MLADLRHLINRSLRRTKKHMFAEHLFCSETCLLWCMCVVSSLFSTHFIDVDEGIRSTLLGGELGSEVGSLNATLAVDQDTVRFQG